MKHIISVILVVLICFSLCSCDNSNNKEINGDSQPSASTEENKGASVSTGLPLEKLKAYASSSGVENYNEVECDDGDTEFSFEASLSEYTGKINNDEVSEFSIYIENVQANTSDEFSKIAYIGYQDYKQLTWNQLPSAISVSHIMNIYVLLGGSGDITIGEAVAVITDNAVLSINDWSISATFDTDNNNLSIYFSYS